MTTLLVLWRSVTRVAVRWGADYMVDQRCAASRWVIGRGLCGKKAATPVSTKTSVGVVWVRIEFKPPGVQQCVVVILRITHTPPCLQAVQQEGGAGWSNALVDGNECHTAGRIAEHMTLLTNAAWQHQTKPGQLGLGKWCSKHKDGHTREQPTRSRQAGYLIENSRA